MKENILVSACLLGVCCRYDGKSVPCERVKALAERYNLIPICPEIYGGLPTPRTPSERVGDKVLMKDGVDVTENYCRGAHASYEIAQINQCKTAILKEKSPSCGKGKVYDGTFSGVLTDGNGVTAEYFISKGMRVLGESEIDDL